MLSPALVQTGKEVTQTQRFFFHSTNFFIHHCFSPKSPLPSHFCQPVSRCPSPHYPQGPCFSFLSLFSSCCWKTQAAKVGQAKTTFFHARRDADEPLLPLACLLLGLCCRLPPTFHEGHFPLHFSFPTLNLSIIRFQVKTAGILYSLPSST